MGTTSPAAAVKRRVDLDGTRNALEHPGLVHVAETRFKGCQ
jgi:hypothetical protein